MCNKTEMILFPAMQSCRLGLSIGLRCLQDVESMKDLHKKCVFVCEGKRVNVLNVLKEEEFQCS